MIGFRHKILILISLVAALAFVWAPVPNAHAQVAPATVQDPWSLARDAYRNQDWSTARRLTAIAAQREPSEPRYYLSLGRIAFQQGLFEDAVWFYDIFIEYAQLGGHQFTGSYAVERARAERDSANTRRDHPENKAREPDAQVRVRDVLYARLKEGTVLSDTGGGALATFESLMQVGYANPDFTQLRAAMDAAANAEASRYLQGDEPHFPALSYEEWQRQARRYDVTQRLLPPAIPFDGGEAVPAPPSKNTAYRSLAEGQMQYLLQNWSNAERLFRAAVEAMPALELAHHGLINAMLAQDEPALPALREAITQLESLRTSSVAVRVYHALYDAAANDAAGAAKRIHALVRGGDETN